MTGFPKFLLVALLLCLAVVGCGKGDQYQAGHAAGYAEGHKAGKTEGHKIGHAAGVQTAATKAYNQGKTEGYRAGFAAARPGAGVALTGIWRVLFLVGAVVGAGWILAVMVVVMRWLIGDSYAPNQRWGKRLAAALPWLMLFVAYTGFPVGHGSFLTNLYLLPASTAPYGKIFWITAAALATYGLFSLLLRLPHWSRHQAVVQALMVFLLSLAISVLAASLRPLVTVPDLNTYLISHAVGAC